MFTQSRLHRLGFVDVTQWCGRAVGIEVLNLIRVDARIAHCIDHGAAWSVHVGSGHVAGIGAHAKPGELGLNPRAARFGVLVRLQHHDPGTLAQHKAITVAVPRARGGLGIVVAGGQGAHGGKAAHAQG